MTKAKLTGLFAGVMMVAVTFMFTAPMMASAALTQSQIDAILQLLTSFQADQATIDAVNASLTGQPVSNTGSNSGSAPSGLTVVPTVPGSNGQAVSDWQTALNAWGVSPALAVDGDYGPKTRAGVTSYQSASGLAADGWAGSNTAASMNAWLSANQGGGGTTPPVTGGNVSVGLSSSNPAGGTVIAGQAIANLAEFTFSNGTGSSVDVTNLAFNRIGISADTVLSKIYLFDGVNRMSDSATVSSGVITFNNPTGIFTVPANTAKTVSVRANIASGATSGQTVGVELASYTAGGSATAASLAGNLHTIASATLAGVNFNSTTTPAAASVDPQNDFTGFSNNASITTRDVYLHSARFRVLGSVDSDDLQNFRLYIDGTQVGSSIPQVDANDYVTFDLRANPVYLQTGTRNVKVLVDIIGGSSENFQISLREAGDFYAVDEDFDVAVLPQANSTTFSARTAGSQTINSGSITFTKRADSPSGNTVNDGSNVLLASFDVEAFGEPMKVESLRLEINEDDGDTAYTLRNGAIFLDGAQVGSSASIASDDDSTLAYTEYTFGSSFIVNPGTVRRMDVYSDIYDDDGSNDVAANDTIQLAITAGSSNVERMSSLGFVSAPASETSANTLTVSTGTLTVAEDVSYADHTAVAPKDDYKIGQYNLQAGTTEGTNLTSIVVDLDTVADAADASDDLNNLWIQITGPSTYTSSIKSSVADSGNTFNLNYNLNAGETAVLAVYSDVKSSITDGDGTGDTMASDIAVTHTTLQSNTSTTESAVTGQTITWGSGSFSYVAGASTPLARAVAGNQEVTGATFDFTATNETYTITEVKLDVSSATVASALSSVQLYDGATAVGPSTPFATNTNTTAFITGLNVQVPAGTTKTLTAKLMLNNIGAGAGTSQQNAALTMDHVKYVDSQGTQTTATTSVSGNAMYVYKSIPTITHVDLTNTGNIINGQPLDVYKFTVTADSNGPVALKQFILTTTWSDNGTADALELESFKVFEDGADVTANVTVQDEDGNSVEGGSGLLEDDEDLTVAWDDNKESAIGAGSTKTYTVRATPRAFAGAASETDSVSLYLAEDSAHNGSSVYVNGVSGIATIWGLHTAAAATGSGTLYQLIWSDKSANPHNVNENATSSGDWANGYLLDQLDLDSETWSRTT